MDEDTNELVEALLARAGAMLEDASAIALLKGERSLVERAELVARAIRDAGTIVGTAETLLRALGARS